MKKYTSLFPLRCRKWCDTSFSIHSTTVYFIVCAQNGQCSTCCLLKMGHALSLWQQVNLLHIEGKRKNIYDVCGIYILFNLWFDFAKANFFWWKHLSKAKRNKTNEYWYETLLECDSRYGCFYKFIQNNIKCGLCKNYLTISYYS